MNTMETNRKEMVEKEKKKKKKKKNKVPKIMVIASNKITPKYKRAQKIIYLVADR